MITIKLEGLQESMQVLEPAIHKKAVRSALTKLARQGKTEASSVIRERFNIKKADLDPRFKIDPPRNNDLIAVLSATGRPIDLTYFGAKQITAQNRLITRTTARQLKRVSKIGQGVTVAIVRGAKPTRLPKAFIATMPNSKIGVFIRKGKARQIVNKAVVTVATLFGSQKTMDKVQQRIQEQWPKVFASELNYYQSKSGR